MVINKGISGSISFTLPENEKSRNGENSTSEQPSSYIVAIINSNKEIIQQKNIPSGKTAYFEELPIGYYTVYVYGETKNYDWEATSEKFKITAGSEEALELTVLPVYKFPDPVTNLKPSIGYTKINLSWTNPSNPDFDHVEITYTSADNSTGSVSVKGTPGQSMTKEITNLTNETVYNFNVAAINKRNNKSTVETVIATPKEMLGKVPTPASYITGDSVENGIYVTFGVWPQTRYAAVESNFNAQKPSCVVNGWDCYMDEAGEYYVKTTAKPYTEYDKPQFDDGTTIGTSDYYFKLEPIKWRVLTNTYTDAAGKGQGKLLLSEKALDTVPYFYYEKQNGTRQIKDEQGIQQEIYNDNYKYSEIRAWLNGLTYINPDNNENNNYLDNGFMQKAFTSEAIAEISETLVDNSPESTFVENKPPFTNEFACPNTKDKIFLLSGQEATNPEYKFEAYNVCINDTTVLTSTRALKTTDYARAVGTNSDTDSVSSTFKNTYSWWLRSPDKDNISNVRYVLNTGDLQDMAGGYNSNFGVVPALAISY